MTIAARYEIEHLQYLGADGALVNEPPADLVDTKLLLPLFKQMLFVRVFDTKAIALQRTGKLGDAMYRKLKVYAGLDHPHEAQQPTPYEVA